MTDRDARAKLVQLLRLAYSGEKAAALAYQGHAASVRDPAEAARIRKIENDEWVHREKVGRMLAEMGATPSRLRELRSAIIGHTLSVLCHVSGWFLPMYFAGRLETKNVREYDLAAAWAKELGLERFLPELSEMASVEVEHEKFFLEAIGRRPPDRTRTAGAPIKG